MNSFIKYQLLPIEEQLLQQTSDTRQLTYLKRHSYTKLQQFNKQQLIYYRSTDDDFQCLRVVTFAFLAKIYQNYSLTNQLKLNRLKDIIYSSNLNESLTERKGIQVNLLHKSFAEGIGQIQIGSQSQQDICKFINSSSFIDQTLSVALSSLISKSNISQKHHISMQMVANWFKEQFNINVVITDRNINQESDKQIFIRMDGAKPIRQSLTNNQEVDINQLSSQKDRSKLILDNTKIPQNYLQESIFIQNSQIGQESLTLKQNTRLNPHINENQMKPIIQNSRKRRQQGFMNIFCCCD